MAITRLSGANAITGTIPTSVAPGKGKVLQVVSARLNGTSVSSNSTSFVASGLFINITPSSTSNKIFLSLQGGAFYQGSTSTQVTMRTTIYRDSTDLGYSTYGLNRHSGDGGQWNITPHSCSVYDAPSSTSQIKYEVYFKNADTSSTVQFNDADRGAPTLTAYEIAG